jgi:hypothetical protein
MTCLKLPAHCPGFRRQAHAILAGSRGSRKIGPGFISDLITQYNDSQANNQAIISVEESKAIHFLARRSPAVLREIKLAWSLEKVSITTATLVATSHLDDMMEMMPVKYAENDVWHQILKPSEPKFVTFFRRSRLCFEAKLNDKRRVPNMCAPGVGCHEKDRDQEVVWRMSCLWVEVQPTLVRTCSEQQAGQWQMQAGPLQPQRSCHYVHPGTA